MLTSEEMGPEEFWGRLDMITDGTGSPQFSNLCGFIQTLLCLPHANVDIERIFSSMNKKRNIHTKTVRALLTVKENVEEVSSCVNFCPPPGANADVS